MFCLENFSWTWPGLFPSCSEPSAPSPLWQSSSNVSHLNAFFLPQQHYSHVRAFSVTLKFAGRSGHGPKLLAWFQNFCFFVWDEGLRRGSHQIQIFHRVCLKNFCLFDWAWALVGGRKKTKVLQTNPMQNLNLVWPPTPLQKKQKFWNQAADLTPCPAYLYV